MTVRARLPPGLGKTDIWTIRKNGVSTPLFVTLTGTEYFKMNDNVSVTFNTLDTISLKVVTSLLTGTTDTIVHVDRL